MPNRQDRDRDERGRGREGRDPSEYRQSGSYEDWGDPRWSREGQESGRMGGGYGRGEFARGANYGQDYAMQGGGYGGAQARRNGLGPRLHDYGQQSRYGDEWRGPQFGFRGSDRGGQQWRTPEPAWRSQYADVGGQARWQDEDWRWNEGHYGGSRQSWGGEPYGEERFGPDFDRRAPNEQDRWYGRGGQPGYAEPARFAYDEDYWDRMRSGPHAGKGPKGYRRSDDSIRDEVCEILCAHGGVDASEMDVSVADGVVTLSGSVADRRQKRLAEDAIERVSGVEDVSNQLRIDSILAGKEDQAASERGGQSPSNGKLSTSGRPR